MYRCKDPSLLIDGDEEDRQVDPTHASTENIPKCLNNTFFLLVKRRAKKKAIGTGLVSSFHVRDT